MPRFLIRLQQAGRVLAAHADDVLASDELATARYEAERGAKDLLCECIERGRDPSGDAVLIVDSRGVEVHRVALLDALPAVFKIECRSTATLTRRHEREPAGRGPGAQ
jgi:hypothetical protein